MGNIEVTSIELIKPSSPTPRASRDHKLSFLDQLSPSTLIPSVLFYQNSSPCFDQAEISQHLKHSLSEILTKLYPLAGKINGNLSVDCDDLGALFIEARVVLISHRGKERNSSDQKVCVRQEKLAAGKKFASSVASTGSVKDPTLVEAITAFILKHFILVTQAKENRKTNFLAFQAVKMRPRMNLPSDRLAFGNFSIATPALMTVSDTDDNDKEYCDDLVGHLRNATRIINNDYIKILQSGVPFLDILKAAGEQLGKEPMAYCFFTNLCSFPEYGVDYGFGKPISVRIKAPPIKNSVILMSTNSGDGIEAWITMVEDEMAMLPDELLSLATIDVASFQAKL
ncbi:stemmadenine O-acetyltransferase-like [Coffea arabica]|uniref:Stemmadenine O-acetyltransferase-like n=1 Tax=Coffea arabica TaxID=13443 RepID=A0A6P6TVF2_COFAR|nr:vinorine synthase-like [Coffea arabica]